MRTLGVKRRNPGWWRTARGNCGLPMRKMCFASWGRSVKIRVFEVAKAEMAEVKAWYNDQSPGLGYEFLAEVRHGFFQVRGFPEAWAIFQGEIRRYRLRRFPYGILYAVESDHIIVSGFWVSVRIPSGGRTGCGSWGGDFLRANFQHVKPLLIPPSPTPSSAPWPAANHPHPQPPAKCRHRGATCRRSLAPATPRTGWCGGWSGA